ncbi:DUF998 domain-containing protein [Arsukibacterium sp.]|uniref:DUF998 domain-containing protein n=1 Tax=Arsukibacterium sp. TaxID=1977258 RepID=UPI00299F3EE4|nr:DUF998 domain-containing protein [Arsukibacterium sp.]MDX1536965.1 DUF998 domain-containing protein [Arsukibacterium sp.]
MKYLTKLIIILPLASGLWFLMTIILAGINQPGYQHMSQFISELGAIDAANGKVVNFGGFIPASVLLVLFVGIAICYCSRRRKQLIGLVAIAVYAITLGIAAFYPCDAGCRPENPSSSQLIHNFSALLGYVSAVASVFILATYLKQTGSRLLANMGYAIGGLAFVMLIMLNPEFAFVGIAQRVFELSIYTWIILYSFHLSAQIRCKHSAQVLPG